MECGVSLPLTGGWGFERKTVFEESGVYGCWGVSPLGGWGKRGSCGGHVLFGRSDDLRGGLGQEI